MISLKSIFLFVLDNIHFEVLVLQGEERHFMKQNKAEQICYKEITTIIDRKKYSDTPINIMIIVKIFCC